MAEQVLQRLEVGAGLVRQRRRAVAEIMKPDRRHVGLADEEAESAAGVAGVDRGAVFADEDVPGVVPDLAGGEAAGTLVDLAAAVFPEDLDGVLVQGDGTGAGRGLGRTLNDQVAGGGAVAADEQQPVVEVDLAPAQPTRLAPTQTPQPNEPPQGEQRVIDGGGQECGGPRNFPS